MMNTSISIYFNPDDFRNSKQVFGRTSANNSLLKALVKYGNRSILSLYVEQAQFFEDFRQIYALEIEQSVKTFKPIIRGDIPALQQSGLYMHTDPMLSQMSWARSFINPASFSICGVIHTLSTHVMAEEVGKLILAPLHDWDAIVCTSMAAKKVVENLFMQWLDYLRPIYKEPPQIKLQLPVIPLGINSDEVASIETRELKRKKFREQYRIAADDYVVLFFGRLFFYEKAHPIPMYLALEEIAKRIHSKNKVHFVQAGWFEDSNDLQHYKDAAKLFCPSVNVLFINDLDSNEKKKAIWPGADVFISLSDNIQESFGITPLEAMANQLPVIVSDWDGYKDTVRHEIDGFRIPTVLPPAGCGTDLGLGYLTKAVNYQTYSGLNAQMTAVDVGACVNALWQLYLSPELRRRMGESGYQRVQELYDWQQVIKHYDLLWDELSARRNLALLDAQQSIQNPPMLADPFLTYAGYASTVLNANSMLVLGNTSLSQLILLDSNHLGSFGKQQRLSIVYLEKIIQFISTSVRCVQQIVEFIHSMDKNVSSGVIVRSLTYLIKYDFIRLGE